MQDVPINDLTVAVPWHPKCGEANPRLDQTKGREG
jgi:hypothetical protein